MKWRVILEPDSETGDWVVWCPELPGCVSAGETEQEALENIREAMSNDKPLCVYALYLEPDSIELAPGSVTREVSVG
ncbi:type II toxin-antitoxin system HicB family antitoxin [Nostocaceae cyanobacterium CENA369]|uniref:Type II toxin-antitoxin system HicB family antitoxin n=1 Tax=Dendronalium phyllosphericum CENA369 TaxID=1725256 RepID=A0A8J7I9A3_9NOST|nr:type II toxin-antitoxin system HicB family antitoxin [Dendronalium phyllosphericum]MBH8577844.1 type II toxin-antitoxin system HicB family antitoxin [Dendronalium phyllosphericum CENA369]